MRHVDRARIISELRRLLGTFPAVAVLGPRQAGKTTLVREFLGRQARSSARAVIFDLERPRDFDRLSRAPEEDLGLLQAERRFIAIDEVQRMPSLFSVLRPLIDAPSRRARYLLLGSASPSVVRGVSESLAGRVGFLDLTPFGLAEVGIEGPVLRRHWTRGGFPPSFLARSDRTSFEWRESYIRTLLERDLPGSGINLPPVLVRRLWTMVAHWNGGILNMSEIASGLGITGPTVHRYLDVLEGLFLIRRLPPYFANVGKRLVKAPKVYVRDTGLLHCLLAIADHQSLLAHPKVGASWEGWAIEQVLAALRPAGSPPEAFYWRTHAGAEVDLIVKQGQALYALEMKLGAPERRARGLVECMKDLDLSRGFVLHSGHELYPLGERLWAVPARLLANPEIFARVLRSPEASSEQRL